MHHKTSKEVNINELNLWQIKETLFWGYFWALSPKSEFVQKIRLCHFFTYEKPLIHFWEKVITEWLTDLPTNWTQWLNDSGDFVGPFSSKGGGPIRNHSSFSTCAYQGGKKCLFFGEFCVRTTWGEWPSGLRRYN